MADITSSYMGLKLKSPIIVSSCGLTADSDKVAEMEKCGVGAVVVKSLFEEQIANEVDFLASASHDYPEMGDYLHNYIRQNSIAKYVANISEIKAKTSIPIIASINCYSSGEWISYAKEIERAGADGLELNLYDIPLSGKEDAEKVEKSYCKTVKKVVDSVNIPVAVKISSHFTSIVNFVKSLYSCGVKAVVIFNRFFTPDIDLDKLTLTSSSPLSHPEDYLTVLRWTALLSSTIQNMSISVTTGIHSPESAIKQILAGADTVQICSVVYKEGLKVISDFNEALKKFMDDKNFENLSQMCGRLNYSNIPDAAMYERVQFLKTFWRICSEVIEFIQNNKDLSFKNLSELRSLFFQSCRGKRTRTFDPLLPKQVR